MTDDPMAMARAALTWAGAEPFFLDHRKIFTSEIEYAFDGRGEACTVTVDQTVLDMSAINVAYIRSSNFYDYDEMRGEPADSAVAVRASGFETQLYAWLDSSDAIVINRSGPSAANNSKPYQLAVIERAGFLVPATFISNDAGAVRAFLSENPDAVYKSISSVRSIVRRIEDRQLGFIEDVNWCPTCFQRLVRGTNYRAHVLGERVLALRIESDELDYRYGRTTMTPAELPAEVAERCRRLTTMLGLYFSGIDLIRTPHDEWYCFEVNPSPGYSYFEVGSGQPIAAALAQFMTTADVRSAKRATSAAR
jgi:glutathione synthase/RimK-type ligase-like ATP-grasp enzyme